MPSVDWNIQFKRKSFRTIEFYFDNRHCFWQGIFFFWLTVLIIKNVLAEISHITQNPLDICYTGISYSISVLQSIFSQKRLRQHFETKTIFLSLNFTRDKKTFLWKGLQYLTTTFNAVFFITEQEEGIQCQCKRYILIVSDKVHKKNYLYVHSQQSLQKPSN